MKLAVAAAVVVLALVPGGPAVRCALAQQSMPEAPAPSPVPAPVPVPAPGSAAPAQSEPPSTPNQTPVPSGPVDAATAVSQLYTSLLGHWTGLTQYRDQTMGDLLSLATDVDVVLAPGGKSLVMRYTFHTGPKKTIRDNTRVTIDPKTKQWTTTSDADPEQVYKVTGLDTLQDGRGKLTLLNKESEGGTILDSRIQVTVGQDLFEMRRETKTAGQDYKFRHVYSFTRAETTPAKPRPGDANLPSAPVPIN